MKFHHRNIYVCILLYNLLRKFLILFFQEWNTRLLRGMFDGYLLNGILKYD